VRVATEHPLSRALLYCALTETDLLAEKEMNFTLHFRASRRTPPAAQLLLEFENQDMAKDGIGSVPRDEDRERARNTHTLLQLSTGY